MAVSLDSCTFLFCKVVLYIKFNLLQAMKRASGGGNQIEERASVPVVMVMYPSEKWVALSEALCPSTQKTALKTISAIRTQLLYSQMMNIRIAQLTKQVE